MSIFLAGLLFGAGFCLGYKLVSNGIELFFTIISNQWRT